VALLLATLVAALAIPQARSALERWLGIGSARIERVETLPRAAGPLPATGDQVSVKEASRWLGAPLLVPGLLGPPDRRLLDLHDSMVVLTWKEPRVRLMELDGVFFKKLVPQDVPLERVTINGMPGIWLGGTHTVAFAYGQPRIAGPVLLWSVGKLTLRLDGGLNRDEALRIARSLHS
jgi:hypothetical protein